MELTLRKVRIELQPSFGPYPNIALEESCKSDSAYVAGEATRKLYLGNFLDSLMLGHSELESRNLYSTAVYTSRVGVVIDWQGTSETSVWLALYAAFAFRFRFSQLD